RLFLPRPRPARPRHRRRVDGRSHQHHRHHGNDRQRAGGRAMTRSLIKPQFIALAAILLINWILFPGFFNLFIRDGRIYGSLIDVLKRGAPVAILAIGMTAVIATRGVDLSVGAVMAISGAVAATMVQGDGNALILVVLAALGVGLLCGLWNGVLVSVLDLQ